MASADNGRVALVVGVSAYKHVPKLQNTLNDARDVGQALKRLGFDIDLVIDPDRAALEGAVRRLGVRAQNAEAALFFYAGHALELGGRNWLLPATAEVKTERDLRFEALDLETVVEQGDRGARVTLLLMDACRNNPLSRRLGGGSRDIPQSGLGAVRAGVGTLIAFATAPGTVAADGTARNSPFTAALLKHIERPGLEVRHLLSEVRREVREATRGRQIPWENSALEGQFFLKPVPTPGLSPVIGQATPPPATAADPANRAGLDRLFWESVKDSGNAADLRAYLDQFPEGIFAPLARNRLESQTAAKAEPRSSETLAPISNQLDRLKAEANAEREPITFGRAFRARLAAVHPDTSPRAIEEIAAGYEASKTPRAQAAAPGGQPWRVSGRESIGAAVNAALEVCQVANGRPCALIAVDDQLEPAPAQPGLFPLRDMPRVGYSGLFDPERIPGTFAGTRTRPDVVSYRAIAGAKAVAYHGWSGSTFVVTGEASQYDAEAKVLANCQTDAAQKRPPPACFLYAAENEVVLPQRLTSPRKPGDPRRENVEFVSNPVPTNPGTPVALKARLHLPASAPPFSAMVILPSSGGVREEREVWYADMLARAGIAAIVVDSFSSRGLGNSLYDQSRLSAWQVENDAFGALRWLGSDPRFRHDKIGVMGVSKGGGAAFNTALDVRRGWARVGDLRFAAHVPISPPCGFRHRNLTVTGAPIMFLLAEKDDQALPEPCLDTARDLLSRSQAIVETKVYTGAHHAWEALGDRPIYDVRAENYATCRGIVEDDGRQIPLSGAAIPPGGFRDWAKTNCMKLGTTCCGGSAPLKQQAFADLLAFLRRQGM